MTSGLVKIGNTKNPYVPYPQPTQRLMPVHLNRQGAGNVNCTPMTLCAGLCTALCILSIGMTISCATDPNCYSSSLSEDAREYDCDNCGAGWIVASVVSGVAQYLFCGYLCCK